MGAIPDFETATDIIAALESQLAEAQARIEGKWRSVDNVPLEYESRRVLICRQSSVQVGFMTTSYEWCDEGGKVLKDRPWGWQPLPEPLPPPPASGAKGEARSKSLAERTSTNICSACKHAIDENPANTDRCRGCYKVGFMSFEDKEAKGEGE